MKKILSIATVIMLSVASSFAEDTKTAININVASDNFQGYNLSAKPVLKHSDGTITVNARGKAMGSYTITDGLTITFTQESAQGDANADEAVSQSDAVTIIDKYLGKDVKNINVTAADTNKDGTITVADANAATVAYLGK